MVCLNEGLKVVIALALTLTGCARAQEPPPITFDPLSTAATPCGVGTPPAGHDSPEVRAGGGPIDLTVRQDHNRLCYVLAGNADAPVIHVRQGSTLIVTLHNEITDPAAIDGITATSKLIASNEAVPNSGDFYQVIPGMRHGANGATNLHVHGFTVPPVAPGDDVLTVCTDPASGPTGCGQRTFTYRYRIPGNMPEGLYWYHPHTHGQVQAQMLMGLSGAIVVEGPIEDARRRSGTIEHVLIVRQIPDQDASTGPQPPAMTAAPASAPAPVGAARRANAIDTRHELLCTKNSGIDEISLNGTPVPVTETADTNLAQYTIPSGSEQLWRILNAATDAFLELALVAEDGTPLPLHVVARDGFSLTDDRGELLRAESTTDPQRVPPAGRIEIMVGAPPAGVKAYLVTHAIDSGCAGDRLPERRLAVVRSAPQVAPAVSGNDYAASAQPSAFSGLLARKVEHRRVIALAEYPRPGSDDQIDYYIVERKPGAVLKPYEMGDGPALTVRAGTTEEWVIENWTNELHAFHLHQVHFRVLETDGRVDPAPPLLDVVEVPYATATGYHSKEGPVRPGRVRIRVYFPESLAGDIPFHCHLADHEDNGMMAVIRVVAHKAHPRSGLTAAAKEALGTRHAPALASAAQPPT